jgi:hypothetical protein
MSLRRIAAVLLVTVAWSAPAWAQGLYWETSNTGGSGGAQTARFWAVQKKMKIAGDDGHVVIVRTDKDEIISVDENKKTYWEMPFTQLEAMSKDMQSQMETALAQMKDKLKDMPPEQRAMVEKMMGKMKGAEGGKEPQVEVKKAAETKSIIGYSCNKYVATEDGKPLLTAWTTMGVKEFAPLRADFVALQKRLNETNRAFRSGMAEAYAKIDGFPMETQMGELTSTVTKVEARAIPASDFDPPAGFTKEAPPMPKKP